MRRRGGRGQSAAMTALIAHRDQWAAAAEAGVPGAAERLERAESSVYMLRLAHGDQETGELFLIFAREDAR